MAWRAFHNATPGKVLAGRSPLRGGAALARGLVRLGEGLAYSSGLAALVGGAMTAAVGRAFASPTLLRDAALVACGAFVIYGVDRLRDVAHDRPSSPGRTAFVLRRRRALKAATGLAALALFVLLAATPAASVTLCLGLGAIGLLHRRMKRDVRFKIAYVAAAWTAACVGIPWLAGLDATSGVGGTPGGAGDGADVSIAWAVLFVGSAVTANLIASNLRDGKRGATGWSSGSALFVARGIAGAGLALAALAPERLGPLAWIPAAELASLCFFRSSEQFGLLAVDGALLLGALVAICAR
ncbi:MAG: hypothetical protein IPK00_13165 [Deltaproteobacteria bacterium]|nr:hypothetical protein [Deltaproteobacteria bacterium]